MRTTFGGLPQTITLVLLYNPPKWDAPGHLSPKFLPVQQSLGGTQRRVPSGRGSGEGQVAEALFANGLCLPSGSNLSDAELARVVAVVQRGWQGG